MHIQCLIDALFFILQGWCIFVSKTHDVYILALLVPLPIVIGFLVKCLCGRQSTVMELPAFNFRFVVPLFYKKFVDLRSPVPVYFLPYFEEYYKQVPL